MGTSSPGQLPYTSCKQSREPPWMQDAALFGSQSGATWSTSYGRIASAGPRKQIGAWGVEWGVVASRRAEDLSRDPLPPLNARTTTLFAADGISRRDNRREPLAQCSHELGDSARRPAPWARPTES